jgi:glycerophosphoryl diester phosphodiesterase
LRLNNKLPRLIGHRGVKDLEPENTLKSISAAFELGLECVEVDVKISKDNIPLLLHDDTLERTTTGFDLVSNFTFE